MKSEHFKKAIDKMRKEPKTNFGTQQPDFGAKDKNKKGK